MFEKLLAYCEEQGKAYIERENEFPCMLYAGYVNAYREIWNIVANMESNSNPYKQYEEIKRAISKADIPPAQYEQLIQKVSDILGI